jgi:hypothetical protein
MANICGISAAESNRVSLRAIQEDPACWAVTPVNGLTRELRFTSSSLTANKETQVSDEIRADRMVSNIIEVGASSGGEIDYEFSAGSFDEFFEAFLGGTWTKPMTYDKFKGTNVSFGAANRIDVSGGDYTAYFVANRYVKTEGFLTKANNSYFQIQSVAFVGGVTQITTVASTGAVEAASASTAVIDANDFIVRSTAVRAGTAGAKAFDTNGTNGFAAAVAAGHLKVGQRISVEGIGYGVATVTFQAAGVPLDGDTVTVSDGEKTVVFEFDSNGAFTRGRAQVSIGIDADATGESFRKAVMVALNEGKISASASIDLSGADAIVSIRNHRAGGGGTVAEVAANVVSTTFAGYTASYGVFTVTGLTNDVISVAETVAVNANAGALAVVIKGSHLRNPGVLSEIKRRSFTIETGFTDVNQYFRQTGLRVGTFSQSVSAGEIVTGQFAFEGKATNLSQTSVLGSAPYTPLGTTATEVMNATVNIGDVRKNGQTLTTAIQSIEINGEAALRQQPGISSKFPVGIGLGRFNLSGSLMAYFETLDLYDNFLNHDTIGLSWDFKDNDDNFYTFTIPAVKITADPVAPGGIDQDIMEEIEWAAQRDPNLNTMMMIDRMSSLLPATA